MNIFLVPVGRARYELYCEPNDADQPAGAVTGRLLRRARAVLADEQEARRDRRTATATDAENAGWTARLRAALTRGLAAWISQHRLLWHMRHVREGVLVHTGDLDAAQALSIARGRLQRQSDHHRFWMVVDGLATAVFGPLFFFVPGPNLISWYFAAKMAGHWLAFRGARQGVARVDWSARVDPALDEVRDALALPPDRRRPRLRELSRELRLEHLATFVERRTQA